MESAFTFYPAEVDGEPAAFVVDLELEPRKELRTRIVVGVPMRDPSENGLRSDDETGTLDRVQEMIMDRLESAYAAELAGFYDLKGTATLVFYGKGGKGVSITPETVAETIGDIGPYGIDVHVADDPEWTFYIDVLFPDDYALQGIWNRALVEELQANGDQLDEPRQVDHLARFASKKAATQASKALEAAHFVVDSLAEDESERDHFALTFHRNETLEGEKPNQFAAEVLDIVLPFEGEYDGWGAPAVTSDEDDEEPVPPSGEKLKAAPKKSKKKKAAKPAKKKPAPKKKKAAKPAKKKAAPKKKKAAKKKRR